MDRFQYGRHHLSMEGVWFVFPSSTSSRPQLTWLQTVGDSLRNCANIPVKDFALIAVLEDGQEKIYSSNSLKHFQDSIFSDQVRQEFRHCLQRTTNRAYPGYGHNAMFSSNDFDVDSSQETGNHSSSGGSTTERIRYQRHQQPLSLSEESENEVINPRRKRVRPSSHQYRELDHAPVPMRSIKSQTLIIGNEDEVREFYSCRFKDMQQAACKVIGKAFVKLLEPKKQTNYPYTKEEESAPPWWPLELKVRHKEPDHQLKSGKISTHFTRSLLIQT